MRAIEAGIITATTKQRLLDLETKAKDLKREPSYNKGVVPAKGISTFIYTLQ